MRQGGANKNCSAYVERLDLKLYCDHAFVGAKETKGDDMSTIDMKHITQIPSGFIVRKTVNRRLHQRFFGESRYGGNETALSEAIKYRDSLVEETSKECVVRENNARNMTGMIGIGWHCRKNTHRNGAIVHSFRAQVSSDHGKPLTKAWSVQRYGLWRAYENAARWRHMVAFGKNIELSEIIDSFSVFLVNYQSQMEQESGSLYIEMRDSLVDLVLDSDTPKEVLAKLPSSIQKRFDKKSPGNGGYIFSEAERKKEGSRV